MVNLELSSKCNLLCVQCGRTYKGKLNPSLPIQDLSWDDCLEKTFTNEFSRQLRCVYFNGNYGDFAASPHGKSVIKSLLDRGVGRVGIYSNGSIRSPEWWFDLGKVLSSRGYITFSIDGLESTNHIYRVNSNWKLIEANLRAAIQSGVECNWDFLVFKHNAHQIADAKKLAQRIGVSNFNIKYTNRFISWKDQGDSNIQNRSESSESEKSPIERIKEKFGTFDEYVRKTKIHCKTKEDAKSIMIDFEGRVWPCCWMGVSRYLGPKHTLTPSITKLFERFGEDFNSLKKYSLAVILDSEFFATYLESTWKSSESRIYACGRTCGEKFEYTSFPGYGNNRNEPLLTKNKNTDDVTL